MIKTGGLKTIVIESIEKGYIVEDFYNDKTFCANEVQVVDAVKKALRQRE